MPTRVHHLCTMILAVIISLVAQSSRVCAEETTAPFMTLEVPIYENNGVHLENGLVTVSNVKMIPLKITVHMSTEEKIEQLSVAAFNNEMNFGKKPTIMIDVRRIEGERKEVVPIRLYSSGGGQKYTDYHESLSFHLLEPQETREKAIGDFFKKEAARQGTPYPLLTQRQMEQTMEITAPYFEPMYINNPPGLYEITATYVSEGPEYWNGQLQSEPLKIRVLYKESFFEQMRDNTEIR